ncbi:hypothetical protein GQ457_13G012290 [Hibiscus cannabinus]
MQPVVLDAFHFPNCCYPIPIRLIHFNSEQKKKKPINFSILRIQPHPKTPCSLTLPTRTNNSSQPQQQNQNRTNNYTYPDEKFTFFELFYSSFNQKILNKQEPDPEYEEKEEEKRPEKTGFWGFLRVIFSNMWWIDLRATMRLN